MGTTTALLHPASRIEEKVAGLWLRRPEGDGWRPHRLGGGPSGELDGLEWRLRRTGLADGREGWSTSVEVVNRGTAEAEFDLLGIEDPALSEAAVLAANRLYPSQYLDLTPLELQGRGVALGIRQNLPGAKVPWALVGSWTPTVGWATDVTQLMGRGLPEGWPWPGLARDLPGERLQGEHSAAILQTEAVRLGPGESWRGGFFVLLVDDHPAATSDADAALAEGLRPSAAEQPTVTQDRASLVGRDAAPVVARDLTDDELTALLPGPRAQVELLDGLPVSWFTEAGAHLVTAAKQRAVLRPHGQILRPLAALHPDPYDVTSTVWMDGGFCSHLTCGHAALGRILAAKETPLGIGRLHGLRIAVDLGSGWQLLGGPSAWLSAVDGATWFYALDDTLLRVTASAPGADGAVRVEVDALEGQVPPALALLSVDWSGATGQPGEVRRAGDRLTLTPPSDALAAGSGVRLAVDLPAGARVAGDEVLFADGVSRGEPVVTIAVDRAPGWRLVLRAAVPDQPAPTPRRARGWADAHRVITLGSGGEDLPARLLTRIDAVTGWFAHDALVHYLSPRGLEQHTGGAWGTRDVAQGPVGLLRAWGEHDAWRELLLTLFRAQQERGDWPQAFDFLPGFRRDVVADSHGDVVYWPLLALGQYLEATGDHRLLDERVAFTGDGRPGEIAALSVHVERALAAIEATFFAGTALPAYGHGDWNDSLQPADPELAGRMVSAWTVVLQAEALTRLAAGLPEGSALGERAARIAAAGVEDLRRHLLVDGVLAGYGVRDAAAAFSPLIHPRDTVTGLRYSSLAMIHAIAGDLLTPEEARHHLDLIEAELSGPDGLRLFDRPVAYRGGPMEVFQRAEAATYFGREIGLMYVHAHLRYAEALARVGDGPGLLRALARAVPVGLGELVPTAAPRQANAYASSSDAAFPDRAAAERHYARVRAGEVALEGGWRVYSSGPGLFLEVLTHRLLGVRPAGADVELDPVLDPALGPVAATLPLPDGQIGLELEPGERGHGVLSVEADGVALPVRPLQNPYRIPGVRVPAAALRGVRVLRMRLG